MMYPVTQFVNMGTVLSMAPGQSPERPPLLFLSPSTCLGLGDGLCPSPRPCTPLPVGGQCFVR